jgi:hypothetical protein
MHKIKAKKLIGLTEKSLEYLNTVKDGCGCQTDTEAMRIALRIAAKGVEEK